MPSSFGPYTYVHLTRAVEKLGQGFTIIVYGAYNAFGLIGPECNGIAILDEKRRQVLIDEHAKVAYAGQTPVASQIAEAERLIGLGDAEFLAFVNAHPRARYRLEPGKPKRRLGARKLPNLAVDLEKAAAAFKGYDDQAKARFATVARAFLQKVATEVLGLKKGEYDLRYNAGGIAVSGEVTLHSDTHYLQASVSCCGSAERCLLYRTCQGRKDYTGGRNNQLLPTQVQRFFTPVAAEV